ncbi:ROK family glucokinase [Oceanobacillus kimchii]|uniref:ROK family glucokinase n=1 Tax=Oceanobacillus kimchii TaxID=746691 RepID=UPI000348C194|nr:ROK family glucokinase [Oceanobacillus kimchii]MCT1575906.1 ROK family glucokinase [Oceanobacillus kimchii]MCT2135543.1 ROK family glucokinase [Oceanobacillus kimchii]
MDKHLLVGIDIGGTTVKIGFISENGKIVHKWEVSTNLADGGRHIVPEIWSSIESKMEHLSYSLSSIIGLGVGAPGFIDAEKGYVHEAVNIGWKNVALAEAFQQYAKVPVYVENDANIAVLGENWVGAGNQADNLIAITLGTGVGGGIIANGRILNGANGMAGELGHMIVEENGAPCNCGNHGCLETITSATGIVRQALEKIIEIPHSKLAEAYNKNREITSKEIFELASEGDIAAKSIVDHTADVLGKVLANMGVIINPSKVLIGGGVSKAGDQLIDAIQQAFEKHALPRVAEACSIKTAQLGNDAGIIGAAYLAYSSKNSTFFT